MPLPTSPMIPTGSLLAVGLAVMLSACNPGSLDYLQNGGDDGSAEGDVPRWVDGEAVPEGSGGGKGSGGAIGSGGATTLDADLHPADVASDVRDPSPECNGVADSKICWYVGRAGDSCATSCASHGGTSSQAASHVGNATQGGSAQECSRLLSVLGLSGPLISTARAEDEGVGCAVALGLHWYVTSPAYSDVAKIASVQLVCGCLR